MRISKLGIRNYYLIMIEMLNQPIVGNGIQTPADTKVSEWYSASTAPDNEHCARNSYFSS